MTVHPPSIQLERLCVDDLPAATAEDTRAHVASCPTCAALLEELTRERGALVSSLPPGEAVLISKVPRATVRTVRVAENRGPSASRSGRAASHPNRAGPELG